MSTSSRAAKAWTRKARASCSAPGCSSSPSPCTTCPKAWPSAWAMRATTDCAPMRWPRALPYRMCPKAWWWPWPCWQQDRKSTRLNSSHSQISYAVFCLKKKKKHAKRQWQKRHANPKPQQTCDAVSCDHQQLAVDDERVEAKKNDLDITTKSHDKLHRLR